MPKGKPASIFLDITPCKECGVTLNAGNCIFNKGYVDPDCKKCRYAKVNEWKRKNKDKVKSYNINKYGVTLEQYNKKVELQLGGCAICKQPCESGGQLSIDHNHTTGQVRDLLCKKCNLIVGLCNEDDGLLFDVIEYLKRHQVRKAS